MCVCVRVLTHVGTYGRFLLFIVNLQSVQQNIFFFKKRTQRSSNLCDESQYDIIIRLYNKGNCNLAVNHSEIGQFIYTDVISRYRKISDFFYGDQNSTAIDLPADLAGKVVNVGWLLEHLLELRFANQ